jgi:hypothetical protein
MGYFFNITIYCIILLPPLSFGAIICIWSMFTFALPGSTFFYPFYSELIRVAILWNEMWHEALEEASRMYFGDHNVEGMLATLQPLHAMLDKGPETLREVFINKDYKQ